MEKFSIDEEKHSICGFIDRLTESDLFNIEPLPFRRTLSSKEVDVIKLNLGAQFSIPLFTSGLPSLESSQWFPITEFRPEYTEAFNIVDFAAYVGLDTLRAMFEILNLERVLMIREFGNSNYEVDVDVYDPSYSAIDGGESFTTDREFSFCIYVSSERTITFSGRDLLLQIQSVWREWIQFAYR
ncbi:hypothetical protein GEMRC1_008363 [Eukaryota sp. GEM-RC1]